MKKLLIYMVCIIVGDGNKSGHKKRRKRIPSARLVTGTDSYVHDTIYIERPAVEAAQPDSSEIIYTKPSDASTGELSITVLYPKRNG